MRIGRKLLREVGWPVGVRPEVHDWVVWEPPGLG
jgi:hypothetical protein